MRDRSWGRAYRTVADLIDGLTANNVGVGRVETEDVDATAESLTVTLEIEVPLDAGGPLRIPPPTGADREQPAAALDSGTADTADTAAGTAAEADSGEETEYGCPEPDCSEQFPTAAERELHTEITHRQPEVAAYRNEAALEIAYEAFDSFPEMTEALGVDVTPQTVRRKTIQAGIHDPDAPDDGEASAGTAPNESTATGEDTAPEAVDEDVTATGRSDDDDEAGQRGRRVADGSGATAATRDDGSGAAPDEGPEAAPDGRSEATPVDGGTPDEGSAAESDAPPAEEAGLGLPEDIGVEDLRNVVVGARTLSEAARELDRSRDDARDVLGDLGLIDLVHGRVTTPQGRAERANRFEEWLTERRDDGEHDS